MENCKNCIFYDLEYDELRQSGNDVIKDSNANNHYCRMCKDGIPEEVWNKKTKCQHNPLIK